MKISASKLHATGGSALVLTLVVTAVIGFLLAAYMNLIKSQNLSTYRSQSWNSAIPVIEAGIEDALAHINAHGATNLNCDGWTFSGGQYSMTRAVGDSFYTVTISNTAAPVIISKGYVTLPVVVAAAQNLLFAAAGETPPAKSYLVRGVRVTTRGAGSFTKAMVAKGQITLSGGVTTDSFNSDDSNYSTGGQYDSTKTRDNGDVASNGQLIKEINSSGNVKIYGHVSTGPGGTVGMTGNAAIGSKSWIDGGHTDIEPGWFTDDMNVEFPDVQAPFTAATPPGTSGSDYVLGNGNYLMPSLTMSGYKKMNITGNAVLYVTGNINMSGQSRITIQPGASLKLYCSGATANLSGQGVANQNGKATNFCYYGLPSNTSLSLSGNAAFIGVIYAPSAAFSMSGGGTTITDFIGASVTSSVSMSGSFNFHYDESLANFGPNRGFVVMSWNELTAAELGGSVLTMSPPE